MKEVRHNVEEFKIYSQELRYELKERLDNIAKDGSEVINVSVAHVENFFSVTIISRKEYEI